MRAAADFGEMDREDVREETVVGMPVEKSWAVRKARQYC